jgi:aryl-alcohol dehydrogenase-like predicted oxidoreductase
VPHAATSIRHSAAHVVREVRPPRHQRQAALVAAARTARRSDAKQPDLKVQIATQLYTALERLGADEELLAIVGSMNETTTDKEVFRMLEEYSRTGKVLHQPQ